MCIYIYIININGQRSSIVHGYVKTTQRTDGVLCFMQVTWEILGRLNIIPWGAVYMNQ